MQLGVVAGENGLHDKSLINTIALRSIQLKLQMPHLGVAPSLREPPCVRYARALLAYTINRGVAKGGTGGNCTPLFFSRKKFSHSQPSNVVSRNLSA